MRHANGTGSVQKLSGRRRSPYNARITTGWTDDGNPIRKSIGCFATRREADAALEAYYRDPYAIGAEVASFRDVFEKLVDTHILKLSKSSQNGYMAAYKRCERLYGKPFRDIKTADLQNVLDEAETGYESRRKMVALFKEMYKYAMANDIVKKDYSEYVKNGRRDTDPHLKRAVFTQLEIDRLFEVAPYVKNADLILIMVYSGFRISELLELKCSGVDLVERTMRGGSKTEAGKNRLVPIHPKIFGFVQSRFDSSAEYLVRQENGRKYAYTTFLRIYFDPIMERFGMSHRPHDCRHTFFTMMDNSNANHVATKMIGGHSSYKTSEKVYTHKEIEDLREAIELI